MLVKAACLAVLAAIPLVRANVDMADPDYADNSTGEDYTQNGTPGDDALDQNAADYLTPDANAPDGSMPEENTPDYDGTAMTDYDNIPEVDVAPQPEEMAAQPATEVVPVEAPGVAPMVAVQPDALEPAGPPMAVADMVSTLYASLPHHTDVSACSVRGIGQRVCMQPCA